MAAPNFTDDGQKKTFEDLTCSSDLTTGLHEHLIFISVLNSFLSVTAILGNALILVALHKESSLHPPSKLLLRSLATTDLCVGLIAEPLAVLFWMSVLNELWNICLFAEMANFITGYMFCSVSLWTLTAISVDRLLALLLGLRYRQVVTLKRTCAIVVTLWVNATVISALRFWNRLIASWCGIMASSLCLIISVFSYTNIFLTLRQHQNQVQDHVQQPNQTNQLNIARYKKAVSSAIWLQLAMVACCVPHNVVAALETNSRRSLLLSYGGMYAVTLVYLNSSLNPILYCWRMEEVRQAVKDTIRQVLCLCFST